jgi:peptidoglycan/LPS O-acetylase OafA/YrhL
MIDKKRDGMILKQRIGWYSVVFALLVGGYHQYRFGELPGNYPLLRETMHFCVNGICRIPVEAFFALSGYLFFKSYQPNWATYRGKIARRVKTLLIPYFLWVSTGILDNVLLKGEPLAFTGVLSGLGLIQEFPSVTALWYIRDLFLLCLISPLIFRIVERKWLGVGVLLLCGLLHLVEIPWYFRTIQHIFWFGSGAYLALHITEQLLLRSKWPWALFALWLLAIFAVENDLSGLGLPFDALEVLYSLSGILVIWNLTGALRDSRLLRHILPHVFFYYCAHMKLNALLAVVWFKLFPMTDLWLTIGFVLVPVLGFACCVVVGMAARAFVPRLYGLITGGRGVRDVKFGAV